MRFYKTLLFILLLIPACLLLFAAVNNQLGPDPAEALADKTGEWALRLLLLTLLITPLRRVTGLVQLTQFRRMLGLYCFFYSCVHLLVFLTFFLGWQWIDIYDAILERPYITVGFSSLILMLPLALTSTNAMRRKLGRRWQLIHRLIYPAAVLALLHLWWQVRSDYTEALVYLVLFAFLILARIWPAALFKRIDRIAQRSAK